MSLVEELAEIQTKSAFKASIEDIALEELGRLEENRASLADALKGVDANIKAVKDVLRATTPKTRAKYGTGNGKPYAPFHLSDVRKEEITAWLTNNPDTITSQSVRNRFPAWSGSYCHMALKYLREQGVIRLVETKGMRNFYRSNI